MSKREVFILSDPFYTSSIWSQEIISGFREAAAKNRDNVQLRICDMNAISQQELDPNDPVIVTNSSLHNLTATIQQLQTLGIPIILSGVDGSHFGSNVSSVTCDRSLAMTQMVQYLVYHGKTRIALVGFWPSSKNDMAFCDAAVTAAKQLGYPIEAYSVYFWRQQLSESLVHFLQDYRNYDAVICPNDTIAICLARACREQKIRIPEDLFITGASNMRISQEFEPSITTIGMNFWEIGKETYHARRHLMQQGSQCSCIRLSIPAHIIPRKSTAFLPLKDTIRSDNPKFAQPIELENSFFLDPMINALVRFEDCLSNRDETDQKIIMAIVQGKSYEEMEDLLFLSGSAIRYRRNKIFQDAGVTTRAEFEKLLTELYAI